MIDGYSIFSIIVRLISEVGLLGVLYVQIRLLARRDYLLIFRLCLTITTLSVTGGNTLVLIGNLFRREDGNLVENVRHISQVLNALSVLGIVLTLAYIYFVLRVRSGETETFIKDLGSGKQE